MQIGDHAIVHRALLTTATIDSVSGRIRDARLGLTQCLAHPEHFENRRDWGAALSNMAAVQHDFCEFDESELTQQRSITIFNKLKLPFNTAISWISMGILRTEVGNLRGAKEALKQAYVNSERAGYICGLGVTTMRQADVESLLGRHDKALVSIKKGFEILRPIQVHDLGVFEVAARVTDCANRGARRWKRWQRFVTGDFFEPE